jgi:hypothetical protein
MGEKAARFGINLWSCITKKDLPMDNERQYGLQG